MQDERFRARVAAYVIFKKDDTYLFSRRFNAKWGDGLYGLPSGHVEKDEKVVDAAIREIYEEVGVVIKPEHLRFVHVLQRNAADNPYLDFFFECTEWEGELYNKEPDKCDDLSWFSLSKLPENIVDYLKPVLSTLETNTHLSEYGW